MPSFSHHTTVFPPPPFLNLWIIKSYSFRKLLLAFRAREVRASPPGFPARSPSLGSSRTRAQRAICISLVEMVSLRERDWVQKSAFNQEMLTSHTCVKC